MELLWQNGPIVMQSRDNKPPTKTGEEMVFPADEVIGFDGEIPEILYTEEDGMTGRLQIPLDYPSFHLLYSVHPSSPFAPTRLTTQMYPPPPLPWPEAPGDATWMQNFLSLPESPSQLPEKESTVVESSETLMVRQPDRPRISRSVAESSVQLNEASADVLPCGTLEHTGMSFPGGPPTSGEMQPKPPSVVVEDTKQKAILENDHSHSHNEDIYFEAAAAKKQCSGSKSAKRSHAAEVHNLSERRRRDRINEKMRTLKELLPHCTKPDKASLLDDVIEHLKSLKMQAQKLSMGWSVVYPDMQQYVPPMGMDMNRRMVPYPSMMGPQVPRPPPLHMQQQPQMQQQTQQLLQNPVVPQTNPNKPSTSRNPCNLENHDQQFG